MTGRRALLRDDRGGTTAGNVLWTIMLLIVAGLGIDVTHAFATRAAMQATADAAALAAAQDLPDTGRAVRTALRYVELNLPPERHGALADADDVAFGVWDAAAGRMDPKPAGPPNAVALTLRRGAGQGDPLPAFLLRLVGFDGWNVAVSAVAEHRWTPALCGRGGLFSGADLRAGSATAWPEGTCLHGQAGVALGAGNAIESGATISMPDLADYAEAGANAGARAALRRRAYDVPLARAAPGAVEAALAGAAIPAPESLTARVVVAALPPDPAPGTLYVVTGPDPVEVPDGATLDRIGVVAAGEIRLGADVVLRETVLMARDGVEFGPRARLGTADPCGAGRFGVYVLAGGDLAFGDGARLAGVQLAAGGRLDLGTGLSALAGVHAEAVGRIEHGATAKVSGCGRRLRSDYRDLPLTAAPTGATVLAGATLLR